MENRAAERRRNHVNPPINLNPRDRLFHALFMKIGHLYLRVVPKNLQLLLELLVLLKALFLFSLLTYLHFSFGRMPLNCLNTTEGSWPKEGVLRVQIQPEVKLKHQIPRFFSSEENRVLFHPCHNENNPFTERQCTELSRDMQSYYNHKSEMFRLRSQCYRMNLSDFLVHQQIKDSKRFENFEYIMTDRRGKTFKGYRPGEIINEASLLAFYNLYLAFSEPERHYIFEYTKEFGFFRLSPETRKKLKIPVKIVNLDPNKEKCLGGQMNRFILKYFLGYDDVIMNSIKKISDRENHTGYMLNVVTGEHFKFVPWGIGRSSYFISLLLMFLFTISISTLLRYCHQQVFFFIIHVLRMMDMNVVLAFPIAPLFTVILSLVGMETIMSEYFDDTTISFYIILIVWAVDQFDTICCHTTTSQRYWLRFFYLYHFVFYAYHYRFNGQYSSLCLAATWFFIQHSMLYFFHNYELPSIEHQLHGRQDEEAYLDEAVQMIVEGIELVAGQNHNNEEQNNADPDHQADDNQQTANSGDPTITEDGTRVQEIRRPGGEDNGNRVFVFSGEGHLMQMARDLITQIGNRVTNRNAVAVSDVINAPEVVGDQTGEGSVSSQSLQTSPNTDSEISPATTTSNTALAASTDIDSNCEDQQSRPELDDLGVRPCSHHVNDSVVREKTGDQDNVVSALTNAEIHAENVYHQIQSLPTQHFGRRKEFQNLISSTTTNNKNGNSNTNISNNSSVVSTTTNIKDNKVFSDVAEEPLVVDISEQRVDGNLGGQSKVGLHHDNEDVECLVSVSNIGFVDEMNSVDEHKLRMDTTPIE